jgi:5-methylcytosine-specific restriction endonuclease McrA
LRKVNKEPKTPSFEQLTTNEFQTLRKEVITRSIKPEVLIHLDPIGDLYNRNERSDSITVDIYLVDFFKNHKGILLAALNFMITRYLEKINFVPRIAEKVAGSIPRTHLNSKEKAILLGMHDTCFYCQAKSQKGYHMDHVIQFNYLYQTEIFNIVPACNSCNSSKNDRLPITEIFERVIERNKKLILRKDYTNEWYLKLYGACIDS